MIDMKTVTLVHYGGAILEKVLVEDRGEVLLVTTKEEWTASVVENRAPIVVGFRREYLTTKQA